MTTLTISLPDSLAAFIDRQLAAKGYGDAGEYVRNLVLDAQMAEEKARLETLLLDGLAAAGHALDDAFWARVDTRTNAVISQQETRSTS